MHFTYLVNNSIKPELHQAPLEWLLNVKMCSLYFVGFTGTSIDLTDIRRRPSWIYAI